MEIHLFINICLLTFFKESLFIHLFMYNQDYTLATTLLRPAPVMAFAGIVDIPAAPEADKIPRVYVKTGKDNMFQSSRQDLMVTLWPPAQYFLLEESDHSAFFSQPEALYKILLEAASSISP